MLSGFLRKILYFWIFKHLKKVKFQEQVVEQAKQAIKPYYEQRQITKDEYKDILKKAVNKVRQNIEQYANCFCSIVFLK